MQKIIKIKGMHCKSCKNLIESGIKKLEGIQNIEVDLIEENAIVNFDSEKINIKKIESEIESLGYSTKDNENEKKKEIKQGIIYGLIPHIGCIAFIIGSILGVTLLMNFFKPILMNKNFFYWLFALSLLFATLSSGIYLKKNGFLSKKGIKKKWKYLTTMYASTIGINLVLFFVIFPLLANVSIAGITGSAVAIDSINSPSELILKSNIPCPGHAPLISSELKTINGVYDVKFSFPNIFDVKYDSTKTSKQEIFALEVFKTYKATLIDESEKEYIQQSSQSAGSCCGGSTCGASRSGGSCGCGG